MLDITYQGHISLRLWDVIMYWSQEQKRIAAVFAAEMEISVSWKNQHTQKTTEDMVRTSISSHDE